MGRSAEGIARRKELCRIKYKWRWDNEPGFADKERERFKRKYHQTREKRRIAAKAKYERTKAHTNARRVEWGRKNRDRQLATQRKYYAENRERIKDIILSARRRRDPLIGFRKLLIEFKAGRVSVDELDRQCSETLARCHALDSEIESRKRNAELQLHGSGIDLQTRGQHEGPSRGKSVSREECAKAREDGKRDGGRK